MKTFYYYLLLHSFVNAIHMCITTLFGHYRQNLLVPNLLCIYLVLVY